MLKRFGKHRDLPENIVVLRDGVSTGQFAMVFPAISFVLNYISR